MANQSQFVSVSAGRNTSVASLDDIEMWNMDNLDAFAKFDDTCDLEDNIRGVADCCYTVPENYDGYETEFVDNYREGLLDLESSDELWMCKDVGCDPTLAELNAGEVGLQDEFGPLEQCAVSDSSLMTKACGSTVTSTVVGPVDSCVLHLKQRELMLATTDSLTSTVVNTSTSNTVAQPQPNYDADGSLAGASWRCQIVPHSPIDKTDHWRGPTNSCPVLKICKRSLPQFESEQGTSLSADDSLMSQPDYKVKQARMAADVNESEKLLKVNHQQPTAVDDSDYDCIEDDDDNDESSNNASSDEESVTTVPVNSITNITSSDPQKRYFWLYNVQSKGPKGRTASRVIEPIDPHVLHDFRDPALDDSSVHKGRRSSGSDIDANPRRLLTIGAELQRLGCVVNRTASDERSLSAREKNKYASRICRLKRKAQHEANKIKLQGLDHEHNQLMKVLTDINSCLIEKVQNQKKRYEEPSLTSKLESLMKTHLTDMIAEHTDEYVKCVLDKVIIEQRTKNTRRFQ